MRMCWILSVAVLLFAFAIAGDASAQCAMCKATVQDGQGTFGGEQSIGTGLNRGILFLMVMPYLLILLVFRKKIRAFFREFATAQG